MIRVFNTSLDWIVWEAGSHLRPLRAIFAKLLQGGREKKHVGELEPGGHSCDLMFFYLQRSRCPSCPDVS